MLDFTRRLTPSSALHFSAKELGEVLTHYFAISLPDSADIAVVAELAAERAASPDFFERRH